MKKFSNAHVTTILAAFILINVNAIVKKDPDGYGTTIVGFFLLLWTICDVNGLPKQLDRYLKSFSNVLTTDSISKTLPNKNVDDENIPSSSSSLSNNKNEDEEKIHLLRKK
jgi:hypothetical protein